MNLNQHRLRQWSALVVLHSKMSFSSPSFIEVFKTRRRYVFCQKAIQRGLPGEKKNLHIRIAKWLEIWVCSPLSPFFVLSWNRFSQQVFITSFYCLVNQCVSRRHAKLSFFFESRCGKSCSSVVVFLPSHHVASSRYNSQNWIATRKLIALLVPLWWHL